MNCLSEDCNDGFVESLVSWAALSVLTCWLHKDNADVHRAFPVFLEAAFTAGFLVLRMLI